jgi:hypothetical protein
MKQFLEGEYREIKDQARKIIWYSPRTLLGP